MAQSTPDLELDSKIKMDLFYQLSAKVSSEPDLPYLLEQIIEMTQKALKASAASILLFNENDKELYFEAASGPVGTVIKSVKVDAENSIAGQVARSGKPVIINDVKKSENFGGETDETTGFTTNSLICVPLMIQQRTIGVLEVLNKRDGSDFNESDIQVMVPVSVTAAMAIENARLHQTILDAYKNTLKTLVDIIDAKDPYTCGHSRRVMEFALMAGSMLKLPPEQMEVLEYAGLLHDLGKIAVDCQILNKPERLTDAEWTIMREHPQTGAKLVKNVPFLEKSSDGVLYHHERYDGKGYPTGIKGEEIPLEARLIAVADAFDTMTTDRSYRKAFSIEYSLNDLQKSAGTHLCPVAVEAFITGFQAHCKDIVKNYTGQNN